MLRGINVTGHNRIRMEDLRALVAGLGHSDVSTYIQSGNVIFRGPEGADPATIARGLEAAIAAELGLDVAVLLRSREELAAVTGSNPFLAGGADPRYLHATFLGEAPAAATVNALAVPDVAPDEYRILDREIYLHTPNGYGRTKLNNAFWERKLGLPATTRNWNTVTTLLRLAGE
jgi:uncharacterized protein (DUF1697 family)